MSAKAPPPLALREALPPITDSILLSERLSPSSSPSVVASPRNETSLPTPTALPTMTPIPGVPSIIRARANRKRSRPRIVVPPFDFVPTPKLSSLPTSFYPPVLSATEHDVMVGLWKSHAHSACASRKGSRRNQNEDRVFCDHHNRIYGVCDGHGAGAGRDAPTEQIAADTAKNRLPSLLLQMPVAQAFEQLDRIVLAKFDNLCVLGTTVAMVRVYDASRVMQVAHVGDSRVMVIAADGRATTLTTDHSPNRPDERHRIENGGGFVLEGRVNRILSVSRAIGDNLLKQIVPPTPDVTNYALNDDDQLVVLATDGLWDVVSEDEVAQCCLRTKQREGATCVPLDLQAAADAVLDLAAERCSRDDMTVVMVDVRARICRK